ncbi:MAG: ribosome biogenesis GTP-binding protein YihA/YsxC [Steroidobacteraceae bacterium]|nr:ribosome biogenesis GTP-binding protein YihA/YsxC [Steroidobacteraceae bacterium]
MSVAAPAQFPPDSGVEVAFAGRSNAGKSSAINALCERKALARTSKTPGRTQLLNYFQVEPGERLVDLPGYGFADVRADERRKWAPLIDALRERESLRALFLIVDSRRGIRDEDVALVEWAQPERRAVHVLLAKCDKLNRAEQSKLMRESRAILGDAASAQLFSAHDGQGVREAQNALLAAFGRHGAAGA